MYSTFSLDMLEKRKRKLKRIPPEYWEPDLFEEDSDLEDIPFDDLDKDNWPWVAPYESETVVSLHIVRLSTSMYPELTVDIRFQLEAQDSRGR